MRPLKYSFLAMASAYAFIAPHVASAQSADEAEAGADERNVIIVTAQKREQALLDVPLSISVLGEEEIGARGATTIDDLQYSIPGLSITEFAPGTQRIQIRGISVFSGLPTVGTYLNDMPLNLEQNQTGLDVRFLDVARVEVIRGPQGTLYGQGSLGGTIKYVTNDVNYSRIEASGQGEVGLVDDGGANFNLQGVVNLPVAEDRAGLRLAASYQEFGGWIDNPLSGEKNINSGDSLTLRATFGVLLTEAVEATFMVQHQELSLGGQNYSDANQQAPLPLGSAITSDATLLNATIKADLGFAELLSSTGYIDRSDSIVNDLTASFAPFLETPPPVGFGFPPGTFEALGIVLSSDNEIFVQELRLASSGSGPFSWTVGGFYRDSRTGSLVESTVVPDILPVAFLEGSGTLPSDSESWAVFGEASYDLSDRLTALVGLRYFEDRRIQATTSSFFGNPSVNTGEATFDQLSPRFNLSFRPTEEVNLYVNVAQGFRSGGFNNTSAGLGVFDVPPTFDPDKLWTYEAGARYSSASGVIDGEVAVYRNEWSDVQSSAFAPGGLPIQFTVNGSELAGWGVDAAFTVRPVTGLSLSATAGWNDMEFQTTTPEKNAGDPADFVPRFTASASLGYEFDLGKLDGLARIDYQYSDRFQIFSRNIQAVPAFSDEQNIVNARLGIGGNNWNAALYVRNLLNRDSVVYPAFASLILPSRLEPRVIGLTVSMSYP
ncbi:MAG: TonB-dependent receptor [Gammaproteobacteria bacterium]